MNIYLNVIFKTIISNYIQKQKYDKDKTKNKPPYVPLNIQEKYMISRPAFYELEVYPKTKYNNINVINKLNEPEKALLFGEDSKIKINNIFYSTNKKKYVIDCKLFLNDPKLLTNAYPDGLYYLISDSWKFMGFNEGVEVISAVDLL